MSILDRVLSLLGLREERSRDGDARAGAPESAVSVEHEPGREAPADATDTPGSSGGAETAHTTPGGRTDGVDAAEEAETEEADTATDARVGGEPDRPAADEAPADESTPEDGPEADAAGSTRYADADGATEPVESIKGIGPAYAARLDRLDVETVGDLAAADPAALADGSDISEKRIARWIERARTRLE
jgi:predicted flap endonuclease-1-like 5' DNA nuclease